MPAEPSKSPEAPPGDAAGTVTIVTAAGLSIVLTLDAYRLALIGVVDFEGNWRAMEAAAGLVVDGPAKAALLKEQLAPIADQLSVLTDRDVEVLALLAARHWFRNGTCRRTAGVSPQ